MDALSWTRHVQNVKMMRCGGSDLQSCVASGQVAAQHAGRISFNDDHALISVKLSDSVSPEQREQYNAASGQCMFLLLSKPPQNLSCEVKGSSESLEVLLRIEKDALQMLPLLADLEKVSAASEESCEDGDITKKASFAPPASVWALVTLLLLLEKHCTVDRMFCCDGDGDGDPSLPGQTLAMADYVGATVVREAILSWLGEAFVTVHDVIRASYCGVSEKGQAAAFQVPGFWYYTQVLEGLPDESFCSMMELLKKTDRFLPGSDDPPNGGSPKGDRTPYLTGLSHILRQKMMRWIQVEHGKDSLTLPWDYGCALSTVPVLLYNLVGFDHLKNLHLNLSGSQSDVKAVLSSLEHASHSLPGLRALGLLQHAAEMNDLLLLGRVFKNLARSVEKLEWTGLPQGCLIMQCGQTATDRTMLFTTVALLKNLQVVVMPEWEKIVGSELGCVAALRSLPRLEKVLVTEVGDRKPFKDLTHLKFEKIVEAEAA